MADVTIIGDIVTLSASGITTPAVTITGNVTTGGIGPTGATGADGADGQGVPVGGTTGQVLAKASDTNYDTEWVEQTGGGGGSGDMLASTYDPQTIAGDTFARANHTGTQTASTISDFDTEVANNSAVTANTAKTGVTTQISNVVEDTTPQLGGSLDVNGNSIVSTANGNILITPNGTGTTTIGNGNTGNTVLNGDLTLDDTYGVTWETGTTNNRISLLSDETNFGANDLLFANGTANINVNFAKGFGIYGNTELDGSGLTYAPYIASGASESLDITAGAGGLSLGTLSNANINLTPNGTGVVNTGPQSVTGNIAVTGTVDGRDVATDGSKLDGIATGATANSADATLLNTDNHTSGTTNKVYTATEQTKLTGIATSADVTGSNTSASTNALQSATTTVNVSSATAPTTGQVLTATGTTTATWQTPSAGGGGNPYGADIVVASTGGDYTTLGEAMVNATAGDVIYVEAGTYTETATRTTTVANLTVIGSGTGSTKIEFATYLMYLNTDNITIQNLELASTGSGYLRGTGNKIAIKHCLITTTSNSVLRPAGDFWSVDNCVVYSATTGLSSFIITDSGANEFSFTNNVVDLAGAMGANSSFLNMSGDYAVISNNIIKQSSFATSSECVGGAGDFMKITNNTMDGFLRNIDISGTENIISNNTITYSVGNYGIGMYINGNNCSVTGNIVKGNNVEYGVAVNGSDCVVTGNSVFSTSAYGVGVYIQSSKDNTIVTSNRFYNLGTGVNVTASTCDDTLIALNNFKVTTTGISDSGTGTITANNIT